MGIIIVGCVIIFSVILFAVAAAVRLLFLFLVAVNAVGDATAASGLH